MDASYKIQRGIHVHLIQFFMCPEFWVHINVGIAPYALFWHRPLRNVYRGACGETDEGAALRAAPCFRFYARPLFMRSCSLSAIMAMNSELVGLPLAEFTV